MPTDKLLAEWFWCDRWQGSDAWLLPLEARGLYREMLTAAWRRGARLPNDHEQIRRAVAATEAEWARCWPVIESQWRVDGNCLVNDTQLEVYAKATNLSRTRSVAGQRGNRSRWGGDGAAAQGAPADVKPEKSRQHEKSWKFSNLYISPKIHKVVCDALGKRAIGFDFDAFYNGVALAYLDHGQPADFLSNLKQRAQTATRSLGEVGPPSAEESAARRARMEAEHKPLTAEEKAEIKALFKGSR